MVNLDTALCHQDEEFGFFDCASQGKVAVPRAQGESWRGRFHFAFRDFLGKFRVFRFRAE